MSDSAKFDPLTIYPAIPVAGPLPRPEKPDPPDPSSELSSLTPASIVPKRGRPPRKQTHELDGSLSSVCALLGPRDKGPRILINLIRATAAVNPEAASFISKWDEKTSHFHNLASIKPELLELLCTECEIPWPRIVGWAYESAISTGQHLAAMKATLALPSVVDKTIQFAKTQKGYKDRDFLYRSTGFLPTPSGGISIVNQVAANAQARNTSVNGEMFTPFEQDVMELTKPDDRVNTRPVLAIEPIEQDE